MAADAPQWATLLIGPAATFVGGILAAWAGFLYRSAHARIQDLSDRLSGFASQQALDVAALRRERAEGDAEVKATLAELRAQVATRDDVLGLGEQIREIRAVILKWGGPAE